MLVLVVPLAAGVEPMNPNLATAPRKVRPSQPPTREATYAMYLDAKSACTSSSSRRAPLNSCVQEGVERRADAVME